MWPQRHQRFDNVSWARSHLARCCGCIEPRLGDGCRHCAAIESVAKHCSSTLLETLGFAVCLAGDVLPLWLQLLVVGCERVCTSLCQPYKSDTGNCKVQTVT